MLFVRQLTTALLLSYCCWCCCWLLGSAFLLLPGASGLPARDEMAASVQEQKQALRYLHKFGYLANSMKLAPVEQRDNQWKRQQLLADALAKFQTVYQLPVTRRLDTATLTAMRQGRCGVGDTSDALLSLEAPDDRPARSRRSVLRHPLASSARFSGRRITWRLRRRYSSRRVSYPALRRLIARAFKLWARVAPLRFQEDAAAGGDVGRGAAAAAAAVLAGSEPDIEIGFHTGQHLNCRHSFDGPGGEAGHAKAAGPIHIDDEENFLLPGSQSASSRSSSSSSSSILYRRGAPPPSTPPQQQQQQQALPQVDLLRVLVHEIGHSLGLPHSADRDSIMHPGSVVRLSDMSAGADVGGGGGGGADGALAEEPVIGMEESRMVQQIYGHCSPRIDAMVDWQSSTAITTTLIVSCNTVWQFDRALGAPVRGQPDDRVARMWPQLQSGARVDALLQTAGGAGVNGSGYLTLLFSGSIYFLLDSVTAKPLAGYPRNISQDFGPKPGHHYGIPDSIDAAYFDYSIDRAVFIKGIWTFEYDILGPNGTLRTNNCCENRSRLSERFPTAPGHRKPSVPLDSAYYRLNDSAIFLVSGDDFWRFGAADANATTGLNVTNVAGVSSNATAVSIDDDEAADQQLLRYGGKVYNEWRNLCSTVDGGEDKEAADECQVNTRSGVSGSSGGGGGKIKGSA